MVAFLYRMPSGIPGDVSRASASKIEQQFADSSNPFPAFGRFGKIASGKFIPVGTGDAAAAVYGLLIRPYPAGNTQDALGVSTPSQLAGSHNVMVSGYASVVSNAGTAALNGTVYIRVAAPSGAKVVGGIEALSDSTNTIAVVGARFMAPADANGNATISFESSTISVGGGVTDVVGKGLIVHRDPDDYATQPTGNAGPRLACAVIVKA